jgi:hypothetical protein
VRWVWHGTSWLPQVHSVNEAFKDLLPYLLTDFPSTSPGIPAEIADTKAQRHRKIKAMLQTGIILDP